MAEGTIHFAGYTFDRDKGCLACDHVLNGAPVLYFVHEEDGDLQFLCGALGHEWKDRRSLHASHLLEWHPDLLTLPRVDFGFEAERTDVNSPWVVSEIPDD